jgi:hypothetical protein
MRQAGALEGIERLPADIGNLAGAGQPVTRRSKYALHRASASGLCQNNVHHKIRIRQAASSNCA